MAYLTYHFVKEKIVKETVKNGKPFFYIPILCGRIVEAYQTSLDKNFGQYSNECKRCKKIKEEWNCRGVNRF